MAEELVCSFCGREMDMVNRATDSLVWRSSEEVHGVTLCLCHRCVAPRLRLDEAKLDLMLDMIREA